MIYGTGKVTTALAEHLSAIFEAFQLGGIGGRGFLMYKNSEADWGVSIGDAYNAVKKLEKVQYCGNLQISGIISLKHLKIGEINILHCEMDCESG